MYEKRYGLTLNPFRATAAGPQVFVGPEQSRLISSLQKALSGTDNVVIVSGPAGVGKTTLVTRALETNKAHHMVAWVGRMRLAPDDVLTLLLAGFGLAQIPTGAVQRFSVFRQILNKRAAQNIQVVVVVEDALRLGNEALLELEAITASEGAGSGGANIILMGPPEIEKRLNFPELARLKQRARGARQVSPLSFPEVHGYLEHALSVAGGNVDKLLDDAATAMIYRCSAGIPRVINSLCDSSFAAAAESHVDVLTAELIRRVAADEYGLEPVLDEPASMPVRSKPVEAKPPQQPAAARTQGTSAAATDDAGLDLDIPAVVVDALAQEQAEHPRPARGTHSKPAAPDKPRRLTLDDLQESDEIPGDLLIADTGMNVAPEFEPDPEFDIPASQLVRKDEQRHIDDDEADDLPMLSNSMRVDIAAEVSRAQQEEAQASAKAAVDESEDEPDFEAVAAEFREEASIDELTADTESTATYKSLGTEPPAAFAARRESSAPTSTKAPAPKKPKSTAREGEEGPIPDLDALEAAISAARRGDVHAGPIAPLVLDDPQPVAAPIREGAKTASPAATATPDRPAGDPASGSLPPPAGDQAKSQKPAAPPLPEITLDKVLEDQRKEGLKLDAMAAELANAQSLEDISDKMAETLFGIEFEQIAAEALANPPATGTLPGEATQEPDVVAAPAQAADLPDGTSANDSMNELSPLALEDEGLPDFPDGQPVFEDLEADPDVPGKNIVMQAEPDPSASPDSSLDSIEDQFKHGMTQTLQALNVATKNKTENDNSGGLLGKLKKTFRS